MILIYSTTVLYDKVLQGENYVNTVIATKDKFYLTTLFSQTSNKRLIECSKTFLLTVY